MARWLHDIFKITGRRWVKLAQDHGGWQKCRRPIPSSKSNLVVATIMRDEDYYET